MPLFQCYIFSIAIKYYDTPLRKYRISAKNINDANKGVNTGLSMESIYDYIDRTIQTVLHFVWNSSFDAHCPGPWQEYDFPIFFSLKSRGQINIYFEDAADSKYIQNAGNISYLPAFRKRKTELICTKNNKLSISAIGISFTVLGNIDFLSFWDIPFLLGPSTSEVMDNIINELINIGQDNSQSKFDKIIKQKQKCFEFLSLITQKASIKSDARERLSLNRLLEPAITCIEQNVKKNLTITELSKSCHMSRSQFHQKFKYAIGISPLEYQQKLRLTEAQKLLLQTDKSIASIGEMCGWNDYFHFCRIFKAKIGCSPSKFRKDSRKKFRMYF